MMYLCLKRLLIHSSVSVKSVAISNKVCKQYQAAVNQADEARLALKTALQACLEQSAESGK
jgi:hypothetical protein